MSKQNFKYENASVTFLVLYVILASVIFIVCFRVSIYVSIIILAIFTYFFFKSLWIIEFSSDKVILKKKGFKQLIILNYNQLNEIKIEKITSRYSSGIRFSIYADKISKIKKIPYFEIKSNKNTKELCVFLSKKNVKISGNLNEFEV